MSDPTECPIDCPNRKPDKSRTRQETAGMVVAAFAITSFVSMWALRAVIERKSPTPSEIVLAAGCAIALLVSPERVATAGAQAFGKALGSSEEESN